MPKATEKFFDFRFYGGVLFGFFAGVLVILLGFVFSPMSSTASNLISVWGSFLAGVGAVAAALFTVKAGWRMHNEALDQARIYRKQDENERLNRVLCVLSYETQDYYKTCQTIENDIVDNPEKFRTFYEQLHNLSDYFPLKKEGFVTETTLSLEMPHDIAGRIYILRAMLSHTDETFNSKISSIEKVSGKVFGQNISKNILKQVEPIAKGTLEHQILPEVRAIMQEIDIIKKKGKEYLDKLDMNTR